MMNGCLLPRSYRLLGALCLVLILTSCGGDADVAFIPEPGPATGPRLSGQVQLPNGQLASAAPLWERFAAFLVTRVQALTGLNVRPVGRNVVVELVRVTPSDVVNHDIPDNLRPVASNSTNDHGQYDVLMPAGTDEFTCMFMVQVGAKADGTRTRAFVYRRNGLDVNFISEAAVRLILEQVPPASLCDFSPADIQSLLNAIAAVSGDLMCMNIAECNAAAVGRARSDPYVQAVLQAAAVPPATLAADIGSEETAIPLVDASRFPSSGAIQIDNEWMTYSGKVGNMLTGVTRGVGGTRPVPHFTGAAASLVALPPTTPTLTPTPTNTPGTPGSPTETPFPVPTATETVPVPTATTTPTATATPTATTHVVITATPTSTLPAGAVRVSVGHGIGAPGSTVQIEISLQTNGQAVAGTQNDIVFDPSLVNLTRASDCVINPAIGDRLPECEEDPPTAPCKKLERALADCPAAEGCPEGSEGLRRFRGLVFATGNVNPIPSGVLYTCTFTVTGQIAATATLRNLTVGAADPNGTALETIGGDGSITILGPTATTAAVSATPTPTATLTYSPVPTATLTVVIPTETPVETPTETPVPTETPTETEVATPTHTATPQPPQIDVGAVDAAAGASVLVPVSLLSNGAQLSAVSNDITYDPAVVEPAVVDGKPDCVADARLGSTKRTFAKVLAGAAGKKILRVGLIGVDNNSALSDGVLYSCKFDIDVNAPTGSVELANKPDASDPDGGGTAAQGSDGRINVTGAPPALDLEKVTASAGQTVAVRGILTTRGQHLSAVAGDITYDPTMVRVVLDGGNEPDCVIDPSIGAGTAPDKELFARVLESDGSSAQLLRVGVIARDNNSLLPDTTVFSCNFRVAEQAGALSILLANSADGSTPNGEAVGMIGGDGAITVE